MHYICGGNSECDLNLAVKPYLRQSTHAAMHDSRTIWYNFYDNDSQGGFLPECDQQIGATLSRLASQVAENLVAVNLIPILANSDWHSILALLTHS